MSMLKSVIASVILLLVVCGTAMAEGRKTSIALSVGAFYPQSSVTTKAFGDSWSRVSIKSFDKTKATRWEFNPELGAYRLSGPASAKLYPLTFGFERALNESSKAQPYVTLRAGPYYGRVTQASGIEESKVGMNANAALGVVFARQFYVEARYDYFSRIAGFDFQGFSVSAGVRLFDIRL